jgi:hypothetical protein
MTEHDRGFSQSKWAEYRAACRQASSGQVLVVPGIEYSDPSNTVHILTWGDLPFLGEAVATNTVLRQVADAAGIAVLAHPSRRGAWRRFEPSWTQKLLGIEVWNRKTDGWCPSPHGRALLATSDCVPFVGIDSHDRHETFPLAMTLDCPMPLSELSILECLRSRRCYATAFQMPLSPSMTTAIGLSVGPFEFTRRACRWAYRQAKAAGT